MHSVANGGLCAQCWKDKWLLCCNTKHVTCMQFFRHVFSFCQHLQSVVTRALVLTAKPATQSRRTCRERTVQEIRSAMSCCWHWSTSFRRWKTLRRARMAMSPAITIVIETKQCKTRRRKRLKANGYCVTIRNK